jgi:hypothetical protein
MREKWEWLGTIFTYRVQNHLSKFSLCLGKNNGGGILPRTLLLWFGQVTNLRQQKSKCKKGGGGVSNQEQIYTYSSEGAHSDRRYLEASPYQKWVGISRIFYDVSHVSWVIDDWTSAPKHCPAVNLFVKAKCKRIPLRPPCQQLLTAVLKVDRSFFRAKSRRPDSKAKVTQHVFMSDFLWKIHSLSNC